MIENMSDCQITVRDVISKEFEIARLKAALKPVMECETESNGPSWDWMLSYCRDAVREAQRIVGAWDDKNYFWKDNNRVAKAVRESEGKL